MKNILLSLIFACLTFPALAKDPIAKKADKPAAVKCPICGKAANPKCSVEYEKVTYTFNSGECRKKFNAKRAESLYQKLGGKPAIDAAVDRFYKKVLADKRINHFFEDVDMKRQHRKQKEFLSAALGGPKPWKGKDLRRAHYTLDGLNDSHFDAVAENLQASLTELKVEKELIAKVMAVVGSVRDDVLNRKKQAAEEKSAEAKEAAATPKKKVD